MNEADPSPGPGPSRHRPVPRLGSAGRLVVLHGLVLGLVLGAVTVALVRNVTRNYQAVAGQALTAELGSFERAAAARPAGQPLTRFAAGYLAEHALPAGEVVVIAVRSDGEVGAAGATQLLSQPVVRAALASPPSSGQLRAVTLGETPTELLVAPIHLGGTPVGTFLATADLTPFARQRSRVLALSLSGGLVALVVAMTSAFLLLRRLLRTVGRITTTAEKITEGDLHRRIGGHAAADEVGMLARSFDSMLDRLDTAVTAQRQLLSDVSHQLRTPLTVARGHLEVLGRTDLGDPGSVRDTVELVVEELDHMRVVVDRLLQLGQAMEPDLLDRESIDLRSFLADLHDAAGVMADRCWRLGPVPDVVVEADPDQLRGALLNLLDNAVHATRAGDVVSLGAELDRTRRRLRIVVEDSGPGIPAEQREAVLARFARPGGRDAGGTGLGLAIVKAVAESHGGTLEVDASELGGARVGVCLPVTAAVVGGGV